MQRPTTKSLLKDGSWIRRPDDEDEDVDRDPNFALNVLKHGGKTSSTTTTKVTKDGKTTETTTTTTTTNLKSPVLKSPSKTETFTEKVLKASNKGQYSPFPSTKTTKVMETTVTTPKDTEEKLYDTLISKSIKDDIPPIDSKTTVTTTETVLVKSSPSTDAEDKLYDSLIPSSTKDNYSPSDSKTTISSTETVTVRSSTNGDIKTINTRTSSTAEDELYGTLLPRAITSGLDSPISSGTSSITRREYITVESSRSVESSELPSPSSTRRTTSYSSYTDDPPSTRTTSYTVSTKSSDTYDVDNKNYTYTKPNSSYEYTSITSPTSYTSTTYSSSSRSDDSLSDPFYSKSSTKSLYASSDRTVHEKDLCTVCRKPFTGEAKMVLDDMKINCHASCFKCEVCNSTLAHLKAGDSMWIYRHMVHCENCFEVTRERWRH
ncbi:sciellin isoform X1 [Cheilinus undulatus]|uniref:sciellin isoform X1 n=1 Tax=Cheilinus undulatus TaxID=241271 RepID=UPI001BD57284|nr:sciellin isoform X1 [Cheilinus undulatus]XP_041662758.1 sciellin isoform X1 [Cheilinus undulatus]